MVNILDLTLRELLEGYCILYSPECGYYYGITTWDNALRIDSEYDLEDCYSVDAESFVNDEIDLGKIIEWEHIEKLMDNLDISKKGE